MSGSMALWPSGSVLISMVPVAIEGCKDAWSLAFRDIWVYESYPATWKMPIWKACAPTKGHVDLWTQAMSVSIVLLKLGSVLISIAHITTKGHRNAQALGCHLWPRCPVDQCFWRPWPHHSQGLFQCLWFLLPPKAELMPRVWSNS